MAGRGRGGGGRGRGRGSMSFDYAQLGLTPGEVLPPVLQPPPTYPPMEHKPAPLKLSPEGEYMIALKKDLVEFLKDKLSFMQASEARPVIERFSDKYNCVSSSVKDSWPSMFNWSRLPAELRPKSKGAKRKSDGGANWRAKKQALYLNKLDELAKMEERSEEEESKEEEKERDEDAEENEENREEVEDLDEEMDDGTDYVNNYFDNGEGFEDEDDNLDDGPVY